MNIKTIIILVIVSLIVVRALISLWKHFKGESSCSCGTGTCSKKGKEISNSCACNKK